MIKGKGASVRIGNTKRPDNFTRKDSQPGPGNYIADSGTFGKSVKGAAGMGSKHKQIVNNNPGPGAYSGNSNNALRTSKSINCKIGTTERADLWDSKKKASQNAPGPGNYYATTNTFGNSVKGAAGMGSKHKPERNNNPGPG